MKNSVKVLVGLLVVVVVLAVSYYLMNKVPSPDLTAEMQVKAIMEDGGCMACHSANPKLPFYAAFPVVGDLVKKDATDGLKHIDLTEVYEGLGSGQPVGEVALAKVEKAILDGTMPMAKYYMVHWGSSITQPKQAIVLDWVRQYRAAYYPDAQLAEVFANEPIRPIVDSIPVDIRKVQLGETLYNDTRLSSDNTVSCASCHGLQRGGVDNKPFSEGVDQQLGGVNAPTVFNAVYNFVQFWDGRAANLAEQAAGPPLNPVEMASTSWEQIIEKLKGDKEFTKTFTAVYAEGYSGNTITDAIAEFEKTLLTPDARFDLYLKGDTLALSADEVHGYDLFKENRCATCHTGPLMGGLSYELMGLYQDYFVERGAPITDGDKGRYAQTEQERDMHRFKVPGLRNVALTAPYFHDATQKTLKEAVLSMLTYQSGKTLSEKDQDDMVAFLGTLTGKYKGEQLTAGGAVN